MGSLRFLCILFLFYLSIAIANSQIIINEVCSNNSSIVADEDGDYVDWIELYNSSLLPINLGDYYLSDNANNYSKWQFPAITISPSAYQIVFASRKNRKQIVNHWETILFAEDSFRYSFPFGEPDSNWFSPSFNDTFWPKGKGGFGRGDGDDNTILPDSVSSIYLRKEFFIHDKEKISALILDVDYDDAFVAYLNGKEIARINIGVPGIPPKYDDYAYTLHPASMLNGGKPQRFIIDIDVFLSLCQTGNNLFCIQAHNADKNQSNFSIRPWLSFAINDASFSYDSVPDWFEANNFFLHTNFKLSASGEELVLSDSSGNIVDYKAFGKLQSDNSFGSASDGSGRWMYFNTPSPGENNHNSTPMNHYPSAPSFSIAAGFYDNPISIQLLHPSHNAIIKYTLNGSKPTEASSTYTNELQIDSNTVVRARAYCSGYLPGETTTATYLINDSCSLPLLSISTNPEKLWDYETGIYMKGPSASINYPYFGANYWQDWEIEAHIEIIDPKKTAYVNMDVGMKIHGGHSRANPMKSLRITADERYGEERIPYPFFKDKNIDSFKSIILRNSGQDFNYSHFRDALIHKLVQKTNNVDIQDYQPAVVFINGEYWGVHNIREKINNYYLNDNYGVELDEVDLVKDYLVVMTGKYDDYYLLADYMINDDVANNTVFDSIQKMVDIDNFIDYFSSEIFFTNSDWPSNNIRYWKSTNGDGKWRYILTDIDAGMGFSGGAYTNELYRLLHANFNWTKNHIIFRRMMVNDSFRKDFINRLADLLNSHFRYKNIAAEVDSIKATIQNEMPRHFNKWGSNTTAWNQHINNMLQFALYRSSFVLSHIKDEFSFDEIVEVNLINKTPAKGRIKINTIYTDTSNWKGNYFDGNPISITAFPYIGYKFSHWSFSSSKQISDTLKQQLSFNPDTEESISCFFVRDSSVLYLVSDTLSVSETIDNTSITEQNSAKTAHIYPNPFNDCTTFSLHSSSTQSAKLTVYNSQGSPIYSNKNIRLVSGENQYRFCKNNLTPGVYFYHLHTTSSTWRGKIMVHF